MAITIKDQESSAVRLPSAKVVEIGAIAQGEIERKMDGIIERIEAAIAKAEGKDQ